jgi:hypothetical protein
MKFALLVAVAGLLVGCDSPFAPPAAPSGDLKPLSVQVSGSHLAASHEDFPAFEVVPSSFRMTVQATTHAACGTTVTAGYAATEGQIDVVARVSGNPLANCSPIPETLVAEYTFTVAIPNGQYTVNMFEARGDGTPAFVGSKTVNVSNPEFPHD